MTYMQELTKKFKKPGFHDLIIKKLENELTDSTLTKKREYYARHFYQIIKDCVAMDLIWLEVYGKSCKPMIKTPLMENRSNYEILEYTTTQIITKLSVTVKRKDRLPEYDPDYTGPYYLCYKADHGEIKNNRIFNVMKSSLFSLLAENNITLSVTFGFPNSNIFSVGDTINDLLLSHDLTGHYDVPENEVNERITGTLTSNTALNEFMATTLTGISVRPPHLTIDSVPTIGTN